MTLFMWQRLVQISAIQLHMAGHIWLTKSLIALYSRPRAKSHWSWDIPLGSVFTLMAALSPSRIIFTSDYAGPTIDYWQKPLNSVCLSSRQNFQT